MSRYGYCEACGRYVPLAEDDSCANGHPRSAVRDVRDAMPSVAPINTVAASPRGDATHPASVIIGKLVVIVPVALVLVVGTALTQAQFEGSGLSTLMSWLVSFASVVATLAAAAAIGVARNRRKRARG